MTRGEDEALVQGEVEQWCEVKMKMPQGEGEDEGDGAVEKMKKMKETG
jgi:hypothetical protein